MNRFKVCDLEEAKKYNDPEDYTDIYDPWDSDMRSYLVDTKKGEVVWSDGGEPEDQSLGRDLYGLVQLLNEVSNESD